MSQKSEEEVAPAGPSKVASSLDNDPDPKTGSFKILNKIGQGGYGYVFTVEKENGPDKKTVYAMKVRRF